MFCCQVPSVRDVVRVQMQDVGCEVVSSQAGEGQSMRS